MVITCLTITVSCLVTLGHCANISGLLPDNSPLTPARFETDLGPSSPAGGHRPATASAETPGSSERPQSGPVSALADHTVELSYNENQTSLTSHLSTLINDLINYDGVSQPPGQIPGLHDTLVVNISNSAVIICPWSW